MVLIDTDVLIDYLRGDTSVKKQVEELWKTNHACVSVLSVYELYAGIRPGEEDDISNLLAPMNILAVNHSVAAKAGQRRNHYRSQGVTLGDIDCIIAGTAMLGGMQVFTRNIKHYPDIDIYIG